MRPYLYLPPTTNYSKLLGIMTRRLLFVLLLATAFLQQSNAQCPGALTCESSQVFCEISSLNGFMCSNPVFPNATFPLGSLCFGAGAPHNLGWWSFVGAGGPLNFTFNLDLNACRDGQGIQAGIFEGNCTGATVWDCNAGCNTGTFSLSGQTIACETYYVWVDGCNSDVCDYTITIGGNTGRPNLQRPLPPLTVNPRSPCLCGTAEVCFPGLSNGCSATETWTVDGQPVGNPGDDCVEVEFPTQNARQVCANITIGNPFDPGSICDQDRVCIMVTPAPPQQLLGALRTLCPTVTPYIWNGMPITQSCINPPCSARVVDANGCCVDSLIPFQILPPEQRRGLPRTICPDQQPFTWHGTPISVSCINPPCTARIEGPDDCLIDSIVSFTIIPPRPDGRLDTFFCQGGSYRDENGKTYNEEICDEIVTFQDPIFGCDTSYSLNIRIFNYSKDPDISCLPCDGAVTLCPNIAYDPDCPQFNDGSVTISLEWSDPQGNFISMTPGDGCIRATEPGNYIAEMTVAYRGVPCPGAYIETFNIDSSFFPVAPSIDGDTSVCGSIPGTYFFPNPPGDVCEYNWSIRQGGGRVITPNSLDSSRIQVDWSNSSGNMGEVCLNYKTDCGVSDDTCFVVDFGGTPQISAGPDTNICASSYIMAAVPDVGGGEWRQVAGPNNSTIDNVNDPNTNVSVPDFGVYRFVWTESQNDCESIDTVTIGFRPDPLPINIDTICGGEATDFVIRFDINPGTAPFTIISGGGSISGNIYTSDTILDNTPTTIVIQDTFGCSFTLNVDHDCTCGNEVGTVSNNLIELCGPDTEACIDYDPTNQILVPGEDTLMYVLYSTQGDVRGTQINANQTGCFSFDPTTMNLNQTYYLAAVVGRIGAGDLVDYDGGCVQVAEAQPVIWYEEPTPDAGDSIQVCGQVANLAGMTSITGSTYRWLNSPGLSITDDQNLATGVTLQGNFGVYEIVLEENNGVCTTFDTVEVTFYELPESVDAKEICVDSINRTNFNYIVCFDIQNGLPPYTLIQGSGSIDPGTNRYCSDEIMSLTNYDIIVEDANGCQFQLTGTFNCDCGMSDPGTMNPNSLNSCVDQCVDIQSNGTEVLQPDEIAEFILHEGSGSIIVNELARIGYDHNANPLPVVQFCFDANTMIPGRVYYISRLIRENNNLDDPCERIAPGTPVIWNSYPTADPGSNQDVCGLTADLNALPSIGTGAWSIGSQPTGSNVIIANNLASQMITVDQYGSYTFSWKEDNAGCADSAAVTITFHDAPIMSGITFECDSVAERYRAIINVANGDAGSYVITGIGTNLVSPGTFQTEWVTTGSNMNFNINDQWDCSPFGVDTSFECTCLTEIGTLTSAATACLDECIQTSYVGGNEDPNDVTRYILHDGTANSIGTVIACNGSGEFCFDATLMTANQSYFITPVAGNADANDCVNLTERCAVEGQGMEVTWYEYPDPDINAGALSFTCDTDSILLTGSSLNALPGSLNFSWSSINGSICQGSNSNSANIHVCASGTYILTIEHAESGCSTQDTVEIIRDADLPNVQANDNLLITCDNPTVTLDATGSDINGNFNLEWLDPSGMVIGNNVTLDVSAPGTYTVMVTNSLTDCSDMATVTVLENRDQPTANIDQVGTLSCTTREINLDGSGSITQGGIRSFSWSTTNGVINSAADLANIEIGGPGDYLLIIVDEENGCSDTIAANVQEVGNTLETIMVDAQDPTCFGDQNGVIQVNIGGGAAPLQYSLNGGNFGGSNIFNNLEAGTYSVVVRDQNGCEKDTMVSITEPGEIFILAKDDFIVEAGSSVSLDTLVDTVGGIARADADREYWINTVTGDTLNRNILDSLRETSTFRVVITKNGCISSDLITIFVKFTRNVFVPNVIFPGSGSGNQSNQILTVHGNKDRINIVQFMRVYDRWGELVYSQDNLEYDEDLGRTTEGWDGTLNGETLNPGVFIYHIGVSFLTDNGQPFAKEFVGDVTLIR